MKTPLWGTKPPKIDHKAAMIGSSTCPPKVGPERGEEFAEISIALPEQSCPNGELPHDPMGPTSTKYISLAQMDEKYAIDNSINIENIHNFEFNVTGLAQVGETVKGCECSNIELLGFGTFNKVYLLTFADDSSLAARLPIPHINDRSSKQF